MPETETFYTSLAPYLSFDKVKHEKGTGDDVMKVIVDTVNEYYKSPFVTNVVKALSYGDPDKQTFTRRVFDYICTYSGWKYLADPPGHEIIYTPLLLIKRGEGDCKKVTTFIASVLKAAGIEPALKVVSYEGKDWEHVYVVVSKDNFGTHTMEYPGYLTLDPVNDCKWNTEVKHVKSQLFFLNGRKGKITMNKISQMGCPSPGTVGQNWIGISTDTILNDLAVGDRIMGGRIRCNIGEVKNLIGIGSEPADTQTVVMHDLVYNVDDPHITDPPPPTDGTVQLYPYLTGMGLDFFKYLLNNSGDWKNIPTGNIYVDAPSHDSSTGQYFMVVNGKRVNYVFTMNLVARPAIGIFRPGTGQSTLIYVGEAAKAQAATFIKEGKATFWDKAKAVIKKVEQVVKDILHVAAAAEFVTQRAAFLGLLKLGKALEHSKLKIPLNDKMALWWDKDSEQVKKMWKAFGGDPAVLGRVILQSRSKGVSGIGVEPTSTAAAEAIVQALPVLLAALKGLMDKGLINKQQHDVATGAIQTATSAFPPSKTTGIPAGSQSNPILQDGASSGDNGMANGNLPAVLPSPTTGSVCDFYQPFAINTWFKAFFLLSLMSMFNPHQIVWYIAANAAAGILFILSIQKLTKKIKSWQVLS